MNLRILILSLAVVQFGTSLFAANLRDQSFDSDWRFLRADAPGAENPAFDDSQWRKLDLPHDWSIEDLPPEESVVPESSTNEVHDAGTNSVRVGPFDPDESEGRDKTGNVVGGIGWYRKHFTVNETNKLVMVRFDGVYMNADFWINGHLLGNHPCGYTSFEFDLTSYLKPPGQENVLAVCVRNEGKNSRWYSGSGIYRHTWLTTTEPVHVPTGGVFVTTPEVSKDNALVKISSEVCNASSSETNVLVRVHVLNAKGKVINSAEGKLNLPSNETHSIDQSIEVRSPKLWSPDSPDLYSAEVEVVVGGKVSDMVSTQFGIRKIEVDAEHGFRLNGVMLKLKGGCVHHDNGPLGSAAIDRAEERRVELLKANGFNAIRTSHNPPSPAFLDACDRLGMLVIDEAFDQWTEAKIGDRQDYHLYFKDWYARDIASMVRRDRNHASVVMWSIGNEIPEQFRADSAARSLREAVLSHDSTRLITQAVCTDWGKVIKNWDTLSDPAFLYLDVAGYNYLPDKYEADHERHPERVMMGTESYPKDFFDYWTKVEKYPYVIGDFTWTAMDYLGEAGIGHSVLSNEKNSFFMSWPWFDAWCGDLDICGFKKPQSFYRDVVWRRSQIEMEVHSPIPPGLSEKVSGWGWPDESQSWNWPGQEGKSLQVAVYSRCDTVRLELNGKIIGEKPVSAATKLTARFDVPYAPGELRAYGLNNGKVVAQTALKTSGVAKKLKLTADRTNIRADRNDLSYVTVEVVDDNGQRVPDAKIPVHFSVTGVGELAGQASGSPNDPASFQAPVCKTFQGRCLAILRPTGDAGDIILHVEADGLEAKTIKIRSHTNS
jgi:beta-galactosidase